MSYKVTNQQLRDLENGLGLTEPLGTGSVLRQFDGIQSLNPTSPVSGSGNELFRGPGNHLPNGSPEITINPAQPRLDNPNIANSWNIEVID